MIKLIDSSLEFIVIDDDDDGVVFKRKAMNSTLFPSPPTHSWSSIQLPNTTERSDLFNHPVTTKITLIIVIVAFVGEVFKAAATR